MTLREQRALTALASVALVSFALACAWIAIRSKADIEAVNAPIVETLSKRGDLADVRDRLQQTNATLDAALRARIKSAQ